MNKGAIQTTVSLGRWILLGISTSLLAGLVSLECRAQDKEQIIYVPMLGDLKDLRDKDKNQGYSYLVLQTDANDNAKSFSFETTVNPPSRDDFRNYQPQDPKDPASALVASPGKPTGKPNGALRYGPYGIDAMTSATPITIKKKYVASVNPFNTEDRWFDVARLRVVPGFDKSKGGEIEITYGHDGTYIPEAKRDPNDPKAKDVYRNYRLILKKNDQGQWQLFARVAKNSDGEWVVTDDPRAPIARVKEIFYKSLYSRVYGDLGIDYVKVTPFEEPRRETDLIADNANQPKNAGVVGGPVGVGTHDKSILERENAKKETKEVDHR